MLYAGQRGKLWLSLIHISQAAVIMVTYFKLSGVVALLATFALSLPIAIFFGWLTGKVLNRAVGQEMITGMMLGYLSLIHI